MLIITVNFKIKPAHRDEFRVAMLKNAATSLAVEPGCVTFDVCENHDGTIYLYERYVDDAAFDVHLKSLHFIEFDKQVAPWVESKQVERFSLISPA